MPKVISEALRHASVAFTMDVYHSMQEDAMALLDEVLPSGVARSGMEMSKEEASPPTYD
jgi:hypothetical protein